MVLFTKLLTSTTHKYAVSMILSMVLFTKLLTGTAGMATGDQILSMVLFTKLLTAPFPSIPNVRF